MGKSITETLKKINIELSGGVFHSILISLAVLDIFMSFKIYNIYKSENAYPLIYQKSSILNSSTDSNSKIYASSKGSKYYFPNCKSSIKEENKIYFNSEIDAENAGYLLSKSCK